jgi:hypothetical protein
MRNISLSVNGLSVSLEFRFAKSGEVTGIYTPTRWGRFGKRYLQLPWEGQFREYRQLEGFTLPSEGAVGWHRDGELQCVRSARIEAVVAETYAVNRRRGCRRSWTRRGWLAMGRTRNKAVRLPCSSQCAAVVCCSMKDGVVVSCPMTVSGRLEPAIEWIRRAGEGGAADLRGGMTAVSYEAVGRCRDPTGRGRPLAVLRSTAVDDSNAAVAVGDGRTLNSRSGSPCGHPGAANLWRPMSGFRYC